MSSSKLEQLDYRVSLISAQARLVKIYASSISNTLKLGLSGLNNSPNKIIKADKIVPIYPPNKIIKVIPKSYGKVGIMLFNINMQYQSQVQYKQQIHSRHVLENGNNFTTSSRVFLPTTTISVFVGQPNTISRMIIMKVMYICKKENYKNNKILYNICKIYKGFCQVKKYSNLSKLITKVIDYFFSFLIK